MLCLRLTLLPLIPLVQMTSESASAKGWGRRGKAGGRRECSGNMSHRLSFISRVRSKIIWILPIKTQKRSHNALNSECHHHHQTWLCNVLPVCFIDIGGEQSLRCLEEPSQSRLSLPWHVLWLGAAFQEGVCLYLCGVFFVLYHVSLDGLAMLIFHSTPSLRGTLAALFWRKKKKNKKQRRINKHKAGRTIYCKQHILTAGPL